MGLSKFLTILAVAGWRGKLECITEFDKVEATSELREINIKGQL